MASFTEWLPRHASLVRAIKHFWQRWDPQQEQQLAMVLRLCRLETAAEGLPPLRLVSFYPHGVPASASLLGELAYVSLQELHIWLVYFDTPHMPSFCAALHRLASLRHLSMQPSCVVDFDGDVEQHVLASDGVVAAIAQLSRLTCLRMGLLRREWAVRFPSSLQELGINLTLTTCGCEIVDVSNLTALTKLMLGAHAASIPELVLPPQLTSLGCRSGSGEAVKAVPARLTGASSLQQISVMVREDGVHNELGFLECLSSLPVCQQGILGLTALSSLTRLKLNNVGLDDVSAIALTMHLTGLQHLHIADDVNSRTLMPAVAGLRALWHLFVGGVEGQGVCDRELLLLSGLTQLSHLTLRCNKCTDSGKQRLMSHLRCLPAVLG